MIFTCTPGGRPSLRSAAAVGGCGLLVAQPPRLRRDRMRWQLRSRAGRRTRRPTRRLRTGRRRRLRARPPVHPRSTGRRWRVAPGRARRRSWQKCAPQSSRCAACAGRLAAPSRTSIQASAKTSSWEGGGARAPTRAARDGVSSSPRFLDVVLVARRHRGAERIGVYISVFGFFSVVVSVLCVRDHCRRWVTVWAIFCAAAAPPLRATSPCPATPAVPAPSPPG